jgi:hypothetical protein
MGVTIHYRGQLSDLGKLNILCDELTQVVEKMDWAYNCLDGDWSKPTDVRLEHDEQGAHIVGHLGLKGIAFKPHSECESMTFFFNSDGQLCDPMSAVLVCEGSLNPEDVWINVKTHFAGPEIHLWIVGLLKYLQEHYILDLEVNDEGEYWEAGNFEVLKEKMDFLNEKMDAMRGELSRVTGNHLERLSPEELASMIEALLQHKFGDQDDE